MSLVKLLGCAYVEAYDGGVGDEMLEIVHGNATEPGLRGLAGEKSCEDDSG